MRQLIIPPPAATWNPGRIVFVGDSNTLYVGAGGVAAGQGYPDLVIGQLQSQLGAALTLAGWTNEGIDGQTMGQMNTALSTQVYAHFASGARLKRGCAGNVLSVSGCGNDLFAGLSGSVCWDRVQIELAGARANGWRTIRIGATRCTEPGTPGGYETERQVLRAYELANPTKYDAYIDVDTISQFTDTNNSTYWQTSPVAGVHWKAALHAILAPYVTAAVIQVMA